MRHPLNVLVLCTGNSARSILGEVLFNRLGEGRLKAYSAGSRPAGAINPGALRLLSQKGVAAKGLRSKSWSEFVRPDAPKMDIVITVCGSAAGEVCPAFPGKVVRAHWGLADPAGVEGKAAQEAAFARTWELLSDRVRAMLALPIETMPNEELQHSLSLIGQMDGAA